MRSSKPSKKVPTAINDSIRDIEKDMLTEINNLYSLNKKNVQHQKMIYEEVQRLKDDVSKSSSKMQRPYPDDTRKTESIKIANKGELENAYKSSVKDSRVLKESSPNKFDLYDSGKKGELEDFRIKNGSQNEEILSDFKTRMKRLREEEGFPSRDLVDDFSAIESYSRKMKEDQDEYTSAKSRSKSFSNLDSRFRKAEIEGYGLHNEEFPDSSFTKSKFQKNKSSFHKKDE